MSGRVAVVAIGRNEGERLKACLRSLPAGVAAVYVDSGSSDDSVAFAKSHGAEVVVLPADAPFTAALARNAGLAALGDDIDYVQMIDGDCSLDARWIDAARTALEADAGLAVVFGRRRERHPDASIYNRLCDIEWDVPVGEANACGGDALFRIAPLRAAGGYTPTLIAGEEPDLCLRMRGAGWRVRRIGDEMTLHDAAMTRFGQWWRRARRGGHAFAELAWRHGAQGDPAWSREVRRILGWGVALPLAIVVAGLLIGWWAAGLLAAIYPAQVVRIARRERGQGRDARLALALGHFLTLAKFPQAFGLAEFHWRRLTGGRIRLIEYKRPETMA